uniref:MULE transposase domain-containing protein n=1 Tax=Trichogramma kaykai TaxID=54128 RepID=A0ABD2X1D0_9HYME
MLRKMVEVIPSLAHNLTAVSTDFERSIITAVREVFPNARLSGCLFHYKQALRRYWYWKCHIPENFQEILEYAMALAYLPAYDMETGFNVVMGLMNYHNVPNAVRFSNYFRQRLAKLAKIFVNRYNTAVQSGILFWSWPAELLRANRDLNAMEPTLPEIGVRNYLEFVVRQRRARFLPEYDNDNQDENPPDDEDDNLVAELNHNGIGLNVFIAQDEIAPIQVRIQDLPDDAEHNNPFAPNPRGRGRGRGRAARGARGRGRGTRGGAGGRGRAGGAAAARGARGRVGRGRGRGRAELPPVEADIIEDEQPLAEVDDFELHEDLAVVVREPLGGAGVEALPLPQEPRAVPVQAAVVAVEPPVEENQAERDALLEDRLENFPPGQELLAPLVPVGAVVVEPSGTNGEEGEQDALQDPQVPELETVPSHEAAVDGFPRIENPQAQPENESQIPAQQEDLHTRLKANNKIQ